MFSSLNSIRGEKAPAIVMYWIGYTYRAWSIISHKPSKTIYKECGFNMMLSLYETYHTFDNEYCVERLEELVQKNQKSDYEIYRSIRLSK